MVFAKYRVACVFIEPEAIDVYSLVLVDIIKKSNTNEIMKISIGKKNIRKHIPLAVAKKLLQKTRHTHLISSIQGLSEGVFYFPMVFSSKLSNVLVSHYMANYPKIEYDKGTPQNIQVGDGLYLYQSEGGASGYVIDIAQIEVETISVMASLNIIIANKAHAILEELKED